MPGMKYRGQVRNGVIEFQGDPPLEEGTIVEIEPVGQPPKRPRPGSPEAILSHAGMWHGDPAELDRLLAELKESKWAEVRAQQAQENA